MASDVESLDILVDKYHLLRNEVGKVIIGQDHVVDSLLLSIFTGGHCLLVGVPGLAKTLMVNTLARALGLSFSRIQFTPDLMPSDITGSEILDENRHFRFVKGPVFANILLADEINRTPPKTQSALLEAMQEKSVTVAGHSYPLEAPFFVLATQNPIEQEGTYPLPEAQVDRFLMKVLIGYPSKSEESDIIKMNIAPDPVEVRPLVTPADIVDTRKVVQQIYIDEKIQKYIVDIVFATRFPSDYGLNDLKSMISFGASPRASINMALASRAYAFLRGRGYVIPEDVRAVCHDVMRHRLGLSYEAEANNITADEIISNILDKIAVP
jgi:MoxR-like ATPase